MSGFNYLFLLVSLIVATGCETASKRSQYLDQNSQPLTTGVDPKYSVAKDRSEFDKLREAVPADVKQKNDEKALVAELLSEVKYPPEVVREKYFNIIRKRRESFNKDMGKIRESFNDQEKKNREEFLKVLEDERKEYTNAKMDREKRNRFFSEQDQARKEFFAEQREKRDSFEADFRDKRKNFDDYIKEKTDEFNAELKEYTARWKVKQEAEKEKPQN